MSPGDAAALRVVLAEIGDRSPQNLSAIENNLAQGGGIQWVTATWLASFGHAWITPKMIDSLRALITNKNTEDYDYYSFLAVLALGNQADKASGAIGQIAAFLRKAEAKDVPFACHLALCQMDSKQRELHLSKALEIIGSDKFSNDPHLPLLFTAERQLGGLRPSILPLLDSKNIDVQTGAALCLAVIGSPDRKVAEKLLNILAQVPSEKNERLRERAAEALAALAESSQLPQIQAAWDREQQAAHENLAAIGVEMTLEGVVRSIRLEHAKD
jgi:hypothetical protein